MTKSSEATYKVAEKKFLQYGVARFHNTVALEIKLYTTVIALALMGCFFIYSASSYSAELEFNDSFYYVKKQVIAFILGLFGMFVVGRLQLKKLEKLKYIFLSVGIVLLAIVFIPGLGVESYGAKRWINLGFITVQPSEFSKVCFVIFAAIHLKKYPANTIKGLLPVIGAGGAMAALIMLEPNMSVTMCLGITMLLMLFAGGIKGRQLLGIMLPLVVLAIVFILIEPYRIDRITAFLNPFANPLGEGYQLIQSYYALGSGGWFGVGLLNSRQKYLFLPFAESDFILSVVGEEIGYLGILAVLAMYLYLTLLGIKVARIASNRLDYLLAIGITGLTAVQVLINVAVVSGSIPPTGIPLPFMSAGGSSLVVFMTAFGILPSIVRKTRHNVSVDTLGHNTAKTHIM